MKINSVIIFMRYFISLSGLACSGMTLLVWQYSFGFFMDDDSDDMFMIIYRKRLTYSPAHSIAFMFYRLTSKIDVRRQNDGSMRNGVCKNISVFLSFFRRSCLFFFLETQLPTTQAKGENKRVFSH